MKCQLCGSPERCRCNREVFRERWVVARHIAVLVAQKPWSGSTACVLVTWCPASWALDQWWTSDKGQLEIGAHMKRKAKKDEASLTRSAVDEQFQRDYPNVYDYLTSSCWDDDPKQPRATATLLVFGADGCWKACLRDRAEGLCCWVAAPGFVDLLAVLERELADGTAVWRLDRLSGAPEAKRAPRGKGS